jgi:Mrp family chromosome partitioning ATPase
VPVAMDRFDSTITEARAVPGALRAGLLQRIPHLPRRLTRSFAPPGSTWELAFRSLAATSISTDRMPRAIMVTSPADATQDAVAANFAAALAGLGLTVALVGTVPQQRWFLHDDEDATGGSSTESGGGVPIAPTSGGTATAVADFPTLLDDAQAARLVDDLRPRLGRRDNIDNLYIVPPSDEPHELLLDGLPPLLEALTTSGIDITVIAGPPLLDDPQATIIAWSTRHVLWAVELGQVDKSDAQLAADRLELAGVEPFGIALVNRRVPRT